MWSLYHGGVAMSRSILLNFVNLFTDHNNFINEHIEVKGRLLPLADLVNVYGEIGQVVEELLAVGHGSVLLHVAGIVPWRHGYVKAYLIKPC